ncbi:ThiF family adenylyltransferase [Bradyrhizobium sp. 166]|uniref:ThiF family adenylyltransferase n=1 Tax=Bradyrhizobium sp. 166 TaxID=2782638 RepID=UPI001FF7D527|nr:ThiF family adenylyltransferase [Bradyrhizobium sp. 166]MCK1604128.1 ThiF family adenylyltransferase [Bradyrhizobium sp. 166]
MSTAAQQNAMMLASLLGVNETDAGERLTRTILITAAPGWKSLWAKEVGQLLGRTVEVRFEQLDADPDIELVIGGVIPRTSAKHLFADLDAASAVVSLHPVGRLAGEPHGLQAAAVACAVAAATVYALIDDAALPPVRLPMRLDYAQLGIPDGALNCSIDVGYAVMAGAGAVGHAFLRAVRHLSIRGELAIVDPKVVQGGILNRCMYLLEEDIGGDKATTLAARAQPDFAQLRLRPRVADFKSYVRKLRHPPETVFVTVDSRRVRRSIQLEVPRRIVDASTTNVRGVVVHSNVLPTEKACLACIYRHVPEEHARERSIAEGLGVDLADVRSGLITGEVARRIVRTHPSLDSAVITGIAFDSLFRQLCAEQALATPEGRQVLAPFAFVSAWAGVLMAVEMLRSFAGITETNYWSVDPWNLPIARGRTLRPRHPECQFCSNSEYEPIIRELWGESAET